eukprot:TRINITY_DN16776_c0_g1_i1.p1 TRINITY_DN16776_c0_g1~~TRINITY_DN16776_c0_g1_i1.p1  ORF type:complete len:449 (-),score=102.01 TRINITY_DN16776_c0_g1_i1:59-1405(-)
MKTDYGGIFGEEVELMRKTTRASKLAAAEKHRQDVLKSMGLSQQGGKVTAGVIPKSVREIDFEDEDEGFTCMVCREGYRFKPREVLGIYTYSKKLALNSVSVTSSVASSSSSGLEQGYSTVTHMNMIHFSCHREAAKNDRQGKHPKEEWEGATLRNQQTKCNNLFPIQGGLVSDEHYTQAMEKFWGFLNNIGRCDSPRMRLLIHDLKFLLLRFAKEESFSEESKGGGPESNMRFIPFFLQMGMFLIDGKGSSRKSMEKVLQTFLGVTGVSDSSSSIPPPSPSVGGSIGDGVLFMLVLSLFVQSIDEWEESKLTFLKRTISFARTMLPAPLPAEPSESQIFEACRPMLIFYGLIDKIQELVKKGEASGSSSGSSGGWTHDMKQKLISHGTRVQKEFSGLLSVYEEELLVIDSLQEFFDVLGVLKKVNAESSSFTDFVTNLWKKPLNILL